MLYILLGADDFSRGVALNQIKGQWADPTLLQANTTELEGKSLSPQELNQAIQQVPFFAPQRLAIVSGLLQRFEPSRGQPVEGEPAHRDTSQKERDKFLEAIFGMAPTTTLVLVEKAISPGNPLFEKLQPRAEVKAFSPPKGAELHSWIGQRVAQAGGRISPRAVRLLAEVAGDDLRALSQEIEKLFLFAQDRVIQEEDVHRLVSAAREVTIFRLVDGLLQGQAAAGQWLHQLLREGERAPRILALLARQLRLMVQARELLGQGVASTEAQRQLGLKDFAWRQTQRLAGTYSLERIKETYSHLLETDLAIKTGRWKEELALDLLLAELCRPA